ncbi:MAG: hypothetical protein LBC02_04410 [Planctomycetaceae bacterium]|nr:hypothetical protein [Planctomycetaceae bacterium]
MVGRFNGFLHCPYRAMIWCESLPTALRWVVTHCPYRGEKDNNNNAITE